MKEDSKLPPYLVIAKNSEGKVVQQAVRASCSSKAMEGFLKAFQGSRTIIMLEVKELCILNESGNFLEG